LAGRIAAAENRADEVAMKWRRVNMESVPQFVSVCGQLVELDEQSGKPNPGDTRATRLVEV
jgi:hypothetical protein